MLADADLLGRWGVAKEETFHRFPMSLGIRISKGEGAANVNYSKSQSVIVIWTYTGIHIVTFINQKGYEMWIFCLFVFLSSEPM